MLASGVRADLNRTVRLQDLSPEVSQSINRSITLSDLDSQVITELNNSIVNGSITLDLLSSQVRNDLNRTITKSMLSQEVLNELNSSSGSGGVVPGSLLAVPANQSAPSGYSLYQIRGAQRFGLGRESTRECGRCAYDGVEVLGGKIYFVGGRMVQCQKYCRAYDPCDQHLGDPRNMSAAREGVACAVLMENSMPLAEMVYPAWRCLIHPMLLVCWSFFTKRSKSWNCDLPLMEKFILSVVEMPLIKTSTKCFALILPPANGVPKPICLRLGHGMKLVWFENRIWAIGGIDGS